MWGKKSLPCLHNSNCPMGFITACDDNLTKTRREQATLWTGEQSFTPLWRESRILCRITLFWSHYKTFWDYLLKNSTSVGFQSGLFGTNLTFNFLWTIQRYFGSFMLWISVLMHNPDPLELQITDSQGFMVESRPVMFYILNYDSSPWPWNRQASPHHHTVTSLFDCWYDGCQDIFAFFTLLECNQRYLNEVFRPRNV